jgi:cellobiose phosphorylase
LYEHCKIAVSRALKFGAHGLPFIGSGDWNDGLDKVGEHGKGESVWLAFFLYDVLRKFTTLCRFKKDDAFLATCNQQASFYKPILKKMHGMASGTAALISMTEHPLVQRIM